MVVGLIAFDGVEWALFLCLVDCIVGVYLVLGCIREDDIHRTTSDLAHYGSIASFRLWLSFQNCHVQI